MNQNQITPTSALIIRRHDAGFKLIPSTSHKLDGDLFLPNFLKLPLKIAFINRESAVQLMNKSNANAWGYESEKDVIGKSIKNAYHTDAATFSLNHDRRVIENKKLIIEEENCLRADETQFQAITAKFPWYDDQNRIIGIVAFAITLGLNDSHIQDSIEVFTKIIHPKIQHQSYFKKLSTSCYLTKRENEIAYHIVRGKSAKQVSQIFACSCRTVEQHLINIKSKLNVSTKSELIEKLFVHFT